MFNRSTNDRYNQPFRHKKRVVSRDAATLLITSSLEVWRFLPLVVGFLRVPADRVPAELCDPKKSELTKKESKKRMLKQYK